LTTAACSPPSGSEAAATAASTCASSVTSQTAQRRPLASAAAFTLASVRPQTVTVAPSRAIATAQANPMPLPPPVTSAAIPSIAPAMTFPCSQNGCRCNDSGGDPVT
jgi:hypothetical protein